MGFGARSGLEEVQLDQRQPSGILSKRRKSPPKYMHMVTYVGSTALAASMVGTRAATP